MAGWRPLFAKLIAVFSHGREDAALDEELAGHIALLAERFEHQGLSPEEARATARRQFGNLTLVRERHHEMRGLLWLANLGRDVRFGARQLRRNPLITVLGVVSLALGIGANTAIFTVTKHVLLDSMAVVQPRELRLLRWEARCGTPMDSLWSSLEPAPGGGSTSTAFSYPVFKAMQRLADPAALFAFRHFNQMTLSERGNPQPVEVEALSGTAFGVLGVHAILGRPISPADDTLSADAPAAVIGESLWKERFAKSPAVLGKKIALNGVPLSIIGVVPESFTGLKFGTVTQVFVPLSAQPLLLPQMGTLATNKHTWWVTVLLRLNGIATEEQMRGALELAMQQSALPTFPMRLPPAMFKLRLVPGNRGIDFLRRDFSRPLHVLLALSGLVLLLACVNLANLLLARAFARRREMSTRLALGARRAHIVRQMLAESLLLACIGGAAGSLVGYASRNLVPHLMEESWRPSGMQVPFDWKVLGFAVLLSLVTGLVFGIVPALQATRADVHANLEDARAGYKRQGLRLDKTLVVLQVALSTILLVGAGLFVRTLVNLNKTDPGFRADHLLLFELNPPDTRYDGPQISRLYAQLEDRLRGLPGVRGVTLSSDALVANDATIMDFHMPGTPLRYTQDEQVLLNYVGVDFLKAMQIPLLSGRGFEADDTAGAARVAVISRALAAKFYSNTDPVGKLFDMGSKVKAFASWVWLQILNTLISAMLRRLCSFCPTNSLRKRPEG